MRSKHLLVMLVLLALAVPASPAQAGGIVDICDESHLLAALAGGGTVTFTCSGTITLTAEITISADTTIDGSGQAVTISGNHAVRVLAVDPKVILNLNALTIADGYFAGRGGGIRNLGALSVSNCIFSGNTGRSGGAIYNDTYATLAVSNSTFSGNTGMSGGGFLSYGPATVTNSTFSGNSAAGAGGGISAGSNATVEVSNSTFSGNTASIGGGNLSYPDTTCPGINADPFLGSLQNNGGPTETVTLLPGSAAIDAGIDAICAADPVNNLDQRGVTRPQGSHCDIGAVEQQPYWRTWLPATRSR